MEILNSLISYNQNKLVKQVKAVVLLLWNFINIVIYVPYLIIIKKIKKKNKRRTIIKKLVECKLNIKGDCRV